jgi:hypothetical protein
VRLVWNEWIARHPRFHVHFTPTGSSWINQVERWFAYLTTQKLQRGVHKSVQSLEADIRDWITQRNTAPRPFVWKKTAEEILDSLARYLQRISGGEQDREGLDRAPVLGCGWRGCCRSARVEGGPASCSSVSANCPVRPRRACSSPQDPWVAPAQN